MEKDGKKGSGHPFRKGLAYLTSRGIAETAAHAREKFADARFDYDRWAHEQETGPAAYGYQRQRRMTYMPHVHVMAVRPAADREDRGGRSLPESSRPVLPAVCARTALSVAGQSYRHTDMIDVLTKMAADDDLLLFVRDGDILERGAVYELVCSMQGGAAAAYGDSDYYRLLPPSGRARHEEDGDEEERFAFQDPLFKPDYNPDYLRSMNYIGFPYAVRAGIVRSFYQGGEEGSLLRDGFHMVPSAWDLADIGEYYDLVLRTSRRAQMEGGVAHAAKVLLHEPAGKTMADCAPAGSPILQLESAGRTMAGCAPAGSPIPQLEPAGREACSHAEAEQMRRALEREHAEAERMRRALEREHAEAEQMRRALERDLFERGLQGRAEDGPWPGTFRIRYDVPGDPFVSIIIPNKDQVPVLENCLDSIARHTKWKNLEIVIVENSSTEERTFEFYRSLQEGGCHGIPVRIVRYPHTFHFSRIINEGVRASRGDCLVLMNNDVTVQTDDWLQRLLGQCAGNGAAAAGPKLLYPDGRVQSAGIVVGLMGSAGSMMVGEPGDAPGYMGRAVLQQDMSAVTAACMMVRRDAFLQAGGFPDDFPVALNDVDFCLKLVTSGQRVVFDPSVTMIHHESRTRGLEDTAEKRRRFQREKKLFRRKWASFLKEGDPNYNPNLSDRKCDYSQKTYR